MNVKLTPTQVRVLRQIEWHEHGYDGYFYDKPNTWESYGRTLRVLARHGFIEIIKSTPLYHRTRGDRLGEETIFKMTDLGRKRAREERAKAGAAKE